MGIEPTMMSHPMRASGSLRGTRPASERNQRPMMRTMSRQKKTTTAASVPICVIAVKAAPGSCAAGMRAPTIRRWALEETGRNSVSPWTSPRMMASMSMSAFRWRSGEGDAAASDSSGQYVRSRSTSTSCPKSRASRGTRSSTPWNMPVKSRSAGSRRGAKP